ncbi:MAG: CusA/CzcA family heavy metal efflux RND transporter [Helicobacter sp.]|nr:CusA/CzcA family heavy metal efflux RND transporter [Helicobacter sp.]MDY5740473.1 CusA/CzcA family heavy metal efflux RND transporter [Helicobacter sp.]
MKEPTQTHAHHSQNAFIDSIILWSAENKFIVLLISFLLALGSFFILPKLRLDALPDLSPPQVVLQIDFPNQGAKIIQEQVMYPLVSSLMSIANVEVVRGIAGYENALVYVIFKDKTDLYWGRSRILEQLNQVQNLPPQAKISLGSDSTSVGWAYQYALLSDNKDLSQLKDLQDFYYQYAFLSIDGVSEVASIGGFSQNYEITLDNEKLLLYDLSLKEVLDSIQKTNNDSGGGVLIESGFEKIIQAKGYIQNTQDLENVIIKLVNGIPLKLKDIGEVRIVPKPRRGIADLDGKGEVVGGIVIVKYGGNTYQTLQKIKEKVNELNAANDGVSITPVYDRSKLIEDSVFSLLHTLFEESLIVLIITAIFLLHFRSALVVIITLVLCVLYTALLMWWFGIESTIMSLGGIAIAIGAMVDAAIVMIENVHKNLNHSTQPMREKIIIQSTQQVGSPIFFALIIVVVSFLPIFALNGQEEKLFAPLAFTKTFAMLSGAILSITIVPILMLFFLKGKIIPETKNPINMFFIRIYRFALVYTLKFKWIFLASCGALFVFSLGMYKKLNWEFMPQINEGIMMYMPVTNISPSIDMAATYLKEVDSILASFPEVENVFGKAGRANTSSDPAPLAMLEVYIHLKPKEQWQEKLTYAQLREKFESALQIQGLTNSWTYPIRGRTDMLLSGIRTPLGIKLYGNDTELLQEISLQIESRLKKLEQSLSVFAERVNSGYYVEIKIDDEKLARYGVQKDSIFTLLNTAIGGMELTRKIEGRQNYPISMRLLDTQRNDIQSLKEIYIKTALGFRPLDELADITYASEPSMLKVENGLNVNYIYITPRVSAKSYKEAAKEALKDLELPNGYFYEFSGESEYIEKALDSLQYIIPFSLFMIFVLIFFALKNLSYALLCFCALPFAIMGAFLAIDLLGFNLSIAGVVGVLALLGVATETSIVMLLYLQHAYQDMQLHTPNPVEKDLQECVLQGAALRVRPKLMSVFCIIASLLPIMFSENVGSEITKAIAAPMLGGMITSTILTLFIIPICFYLLHKRDLKSL